MTLSDLSIERPVLTWMMTLSILVFGILGFAQLGVDQYPRMDFAVVTVTSVLDGASPEVMEEDVTDVLEEYLNTIAGLRNLNSLTLHGISRIIVEFDLSTDLDVAAQDVRDKVALARRRLPREIDAPIVEKADMGSFPILWVPLITDRSVVETSEYARLRVRPQLQTIPGVGAVEMFGRLDRNIRIWLDSEQMRARGLAVTDVLAALGREHVEIPGGMVISTALEYSVRTDSEFKSIEEMERLIVAYVDGAAVRLGDVGRVEDGSEDPRVSARFNGRPTVGVGVLKQANESTVAIADGVYERLDRLNEIAPTGIRFGRSEGLIDFSLSIREAVAETEFALVLGAILATLTVFAFLRRSRPTMIVAAAIPLSLIGAFGFMWIFGFTLNVMTLLALTLAVGVVIDDAIVVLENIERHREQGASPFDAARNGTREITFAATAATVSIAAVFLPVVFVTGIVGNFLGEFGGTVAAAVMISLFVALTLTPMLAARMPPPSERTHGGIHHRLELGFEATERAYRVALDWTLRHRAITMSLAFASLVAGCGFGGQLGGELMPPADEGRMMVKYELPPGTSLETSMRFLDVIEEFLMAQPELAGLFEGVGLSGPDGPGTPNQGMMFAVLKPRAERERSAQELIADTRLFLDTLPEGNARIFDMSMSAGGDSDFEFVIKGNLSLAELDALADRVIADFVSRGGYQDLDKSLKLGLPELRVTPDREKAAALGVDAKSIATVVQAMIGGMDVATFKESGLSFDVRLRMKPEDRADPGAIQKLFVRSKTGELVELRNVVSVSTGAAPSKITRTNRQRSVKIYGNLHGKQHSPAIEDAERIRDTLLPEGVSIELSGEAEAFRESVSHFMLMLGLSVLVIYMILAAQFESFVHPLSVMLALPLAMVGALGALWAANMSLNLFSMIGIVLLLGLVTKNSILLIDYTNQLRAKGMEKLEAMRTAAPVRLRPILMTAISMICGVLPAALGVGPGSESRAPMGVATAAGMFSATILTLLVVPVFYLVLDDGAEWLKRRLRRLLGRKAESAALPEAAGSPGAG